MDSQLRDNILSVVDSTDRLRVLDAAEAQAAIAELGARFVEDTSVIWWWESLRPPTVRIPYGDADGLEWLLRLVPDEATVRLAVTDDEAPPWLMVEGRIDALVEILRQLRIFEYWIAPAEAEWMVFDTHSNALVVAGCLVDMVSDGLPIG